MTNLSTIHRIFQWKKNIWWTKDVLGWTKKVIIILWILPTKNLVAQFVTTVVDQNQVWVEKSPKYFIIFADIPHKSWWYVCILKKYIYQEFENCDLVHQSNDGFYWGKIIFKIFSEPKFPIFYPSASFKRPQCPCRYFFF